MHWSVGAGRDFEFVDESTRDQLTHLDPENWYLYLTLVSYVCQSQTATCMQSETCWTRVADYVTTDRAVVFRIMINVWEMDSINDRLHSADHPAIARSGQPDSRLPW